MLIGRTPEDWFPYSVGKPSTNYQPLLGVELELNHQRGYDERMAEAVNGRLTGHEKRFLAAAVPDGSVHGIEFVTYPVTLETHREMWPTLLEKLWELGFFVERNSGGLHVHVSRSKMLPGQLEFLVALTNFGGQEWVAFQQVLMGRVGNEWARGFQDDYRGSTQSALAAAHEAICEVLSEERRYGHSRYRRVNLLPKDTIEFRQGHATMNLEKLLARVEFCALLLSFTHAACKKGTVLRWFPKRLPSPEVVLTWGKRNGFSSCGFDFFR